MFKKKYIKFTVAMALSLIFAASPVTANMKFGGSGKGGDVQVLNEEAGISMVDGKFDIEERDVETGYLMRENFVKYDGPTGWERENLPYIDGTTAVVSSKNIATESYMTRDFVPQNGKVTAEFRAIPVVETESGSLRILGTDNSGNRVDALRINITGGNLMYQKPDGSEVKIGDFKFGLWTGFKLEMNAATGKVDILINGILEPAATALSFSVACKTVDGVFFGIDKESQGTFKMGTIYVYKGFYLYEDLLSAGTGNHFDMSKDYNRGATPVTIVDTGTLINDNINDARKLFDGDDNTYWAHDSALSYERMIIKAEYGSVNPVDTLVIKFKHAFKGMFVASYFSADSTWQTMYNYAGIDYPEDGVFTITLPSPVFCSVIAIDFRCDPAVPAFYVPNNPLEIRSFEAYCTTDLVGEVPDFPSDWTRPAPGVNGSITAHQYYGYNEQNEYNVFKLENKGGPAQALTKDITTDGTSVQLRMMLCFTDDTGNNAAGLMHSSGDGLAIFASGDGDWGISALSGAAAGQAIFPEKYQKDMWYRVDIKYDASTGKATVSVNGWSPIEPVTLGDAFKTGNWTQFVASAAKNANTVFYLDEIRLLKLPAISAVPELEPCNTGNTILTMQACTLWRDGTHLGWAALDREEMYSRKPILGWYDEGTAEVADWEIKFAVDHGINNFMYCWYRNDTGPGPVYNSGLADEMWDGIFQSKFRDQINFSLMYTNNDPLPSSYSYDDLMNNLVPYWIETFFKNPNYLKTADGKPIFFIYELSSLRGQVGDLNDDKVINDADVKIALDAIRAKCVAAGLPGIYIVTEYRGNSNTVIASMQNAGFDAVFAYTWTSGQYNMTNDAVLNFTKDSMASQRNAVTNPDFKVIPNISKSWDPRGWTDIGFGGPSPVYMYDLEHYRQLALWVKEVFGGAVIDSAGTTLIMLDNWNEFSEGHWLLPTYGTPAYKGGKLGYGYLDILREVFGIGDFAHTDYLPLEEGFGPYDTWYAKGWNEKVDPYSELFGTPVDNSVTGDIKDYAIAGNTSGGGTSYNAAGTESGGYKEYSCLSDARFTLSAAEVASLKASNLGIKAAMLNGTITITAAEVAKLDGAKGVEIVFNQLLDSTAAVQKIKAAGGAVWGSYMNIVYDVSIKQGGFDAGLAGTLTIARANSRVKDAAVISDTAARLNLNPAADAETLTVALTGSRLVGLVAVY